MPPPTGRHLLVVSDNEEAPGVIHALHFLTPSVPAEGNPRLRTSRSFRQPGPPLKTSPPEYLVGVLNPADRRLTTSSEMLDSRPPITTTEMPRDDLVTLSLRGLTTITLPTSPLSRITVLRHDGRSIYYHPSIWCLNWSTGKNRRLCLD